MSARFIKLFKKTIYNKCECTSYGYQNNSCQCFTIRNNGSIYPTTAPVDITISEAGLSHIGTGHMDSFVEQTITSSKVPSAPSLFEKTTAEAAETTSSDTAQVEVGSLPPINIRVAIKKINAGGIASDPELRRCLESC